eukprot:2175412-Prymnesium_polylepis.1
MSQHVTVACLRSRSALTLACGSAGTSIVNLSARLPDDRELGLACAMQVAIFGLKMRVGALQ